MTEYTDFALWEVQAKIKIVAKYTGLSFSYSVLE